MEIKKERSTWINIILIFNLFGGIIGVMSYFLNSKLKETQPQSAMSTGYILFTTVYSIALIITIIGIIKWSRICIISFGIISVINFFISFIARTVTLASAIGSIVFLALSLLIVYKLLNELKKDKDYLDTIKEG